jgi:predicted Zn-ribbon and HTH transcriptional regulator
VYRKGLIGLLQGHPVSVQELARLLGVPPRDVEDDLRHLLKSLHNMPYRAVIEPARCRKCEFVFSKDKLHKPGKCPRCHGTWISDPRIGIEERQ